MREMKVKEYAAKVWPNDSKMQDYEVKNIFEVVELTDGACAVMKSRIETHFCFGHGFCGMTTTDEMECAERAAEAAKQFENFRAENIKNSAERIAVLKVAIDAMEVGESLYHQPNNQNLLGLVAVCDLYYKNNYAKSVHFINSKYCKGFITPETICESNSRSNCHYRPATLEELKALYAAECRQLAAFEKRLVTYWRRYGASKLKTWTFLSD